MSTDALTVSSSFEAAVTLKEFSATRGFVPISISLPSETPSPSVSTLLGSVLYTFISS